MQTTVDTFTSSWLGQIPVGQVVLGLIFISGVATWMYAMWRKVRRFTEPFGEFLKDWRGELARPGVAAKPGVMERLQTIETQGRDTVRRSELAEVRGEVADLRTSVIANTAVIDLVRPHVAVDLPESKQN